MTTCNVPLFKDSKEKLTLDKSLHKFSLKKFSHRITLEIICLHTLKQLRPYAAPGLGVDKVESD